MICIYSTEVVPGCVMELALLREVAVTTTNIFWILLSNAWWFRRVKLHRCRNTTCCLPLCKWSKHGPISLVIPSHDPPLEITIFMDIAKNPGPMFKSQLKDLARIVVLLIYIFYIIRL